VFDGLNQPTNIHFCPDGRMFIALKEGIVRTVDLNGQLNPNVWVNFSPDVHNAADRGKN
jgi:glucose/arabinose dehydrogenase